MAIVELLFSDGSLKGKQSKLFEVYDQPYNAYDPEGDNEWDTKRDLQKIWDTEKCKAMNFNETNTVMVDSTFRKVRDFKNNSFILPQYTEEDVIYKTYDHKNIFDQCWKYFKKNDRGRKGRSRVPEK